MGKKVIKKGKEILSQRLALKRKHRQAIMLNELEYKAMLEYCKKYKVTNKSQLIREALFSKLMKTMDEDHPTLFDDNVMTALKKY
jgi:hypothetical protein